MLWILRVKARQLHDRFIPKVNRFIALFLFRVIGVKPSVARFSPDNEFIAAGYCQATSKWSYVVYKYPLYESEVCYKGSSRVRAEFD